MDGTRSTDRPVARLRQRGGVIRQRLIAAAWPGLAELTVEPARAWRRPVTAVPRRPALGVASPRSR